MASQEEINVRIMRDGYARWHGSKAGSAEHWMSLIADDVRWRSLGGGAAGEAFTVTCVGKPAVLRYFQELGAQWELLAYDADEFVAQGDRVVMLGRCSWKHRATGREVHSPKADVLRLREGMIVDFMEFYDTAQVQAAAKA